MAKPFVVKFVVRVHPIGEPRLLDFVGGVAGDFKPNTGVFPVVMVCPAMLGHGPKVEPRSERK